MQLTEVVKMAGIVGNGGAGFPAHVKLDTQAEYLIINAAECEPLIETDKYLMRHEAEKLIGGIECIAAHIGATKKVIALKGKYKREMRVLRKAIRAIGSNVKLFEMPTFYPAGDEQVIVYEVTGRVVPERGIPLQVGAVVHNVGTVIQVYEALALGKASTHKYLSVVGEVIQPTMLYVPIGTPVTQCIAVAEALRPAYAIIMGGPMMGKVYTDPEVIKDLVITKTDGNILVLPTDHYLVQQAKLSITQVARRAKSACIQCRMCTELCPRRALGHNIYPHQVMRNLYREGMLETDEEYIKAFESAVNCSECGICEQYACPMLLSPRQVNHYIKGCLQKRGIQVMRQAATPVDTERAYKRIPTEKLIYRLGLQGYDKHQPFDRCVAIQPEEVRIPLKQHIGVPAEPVVYEGCEVDVGDVIAQIPEGKMGATIHSSIKGVVVDVDDAITLLAKE